MFIGTGITISFDSGFLAEILDVGGPDASRESVNVSHMGTSDAHVFLPTKLIDNGEFTVQIGFAPGTEPPMDEDAEAIVITFADSATSTWSFSGFMTGFSPKNPLEDKAVADVTIKVTGAISYA